MRKYLLGTVAVNFAAAGLIIAAAFSQPTINPPGTAPTNSAGAYNYTHITTDTTTNIKTTPGVLHTVCVNTLAATGTATINDGSNVIGVLTSAANGCNVYDVAFNTSLSIVTATAAPDLTITWR